MASLKHTALPAVLGIDRMLVTKEVGRALDLGYWESQLNVCTCAHAHIQELEEKMVKK